jgi:hypothetical protein
MSTKKTDVLAIALTWHFSFCSLPDFFLPGFFKRAQYQLEENTLSIGWNRFTVEVLLPITVNRQLIKKMDISPSNILII